MKALRNYPARPLMVVFAFWAAASLHVQSQPYTWSTIAGKPQYNALVDGTNSQARFVNPSAAACGAGGTLFIGDLSAIRQVVPLGTNWVVTAITGNQWGGSADGTNRAALFRQPTGIAVDRANNLFVADWGNHNIRKVTPVGTNWVVTTVAGLAAVHGYADGTNSDARFSDPCGIAVDPTGALFVADSANSTIRKVLSVGTNWVVSTIAGLAGTPANTDGTNSDARFGNPTGIAFDKAGNLYVADSSLCTIRKLTPVGSNWVVTTIAGLAGTSGFANGTNSDARFNFPNGVRVASDGSVYVADTHNELIRKLTPIRSDWVVTTIAGMHLIKGSQDGIGSNATFYDPLDLAVDADNNVYVADYINGTLRLGLAPLIKPPSLRIDINGEQATISWPLAATNFLLEACASVCPEETWNTTVDGVRQSGPSYILTTNLSSTAVFYRLHAQNYP